MTRKSRLILLLTCLFSFALIAPAAVLYSQGYRFDFKNKKITQTGGIFLKASPRQANIYLDGKLVKTTDFFFGSVLIENLLPGFYGIRVEKEGYSPWEKTLEVKEKEVNETKFITLIPAKNDFEILAKNVDNFWPAPDGKKIILQEPGTKGWSLKIYDTEKNLKSNLLGEKDVSLKGADLLGLEFTPDSKEIYLSVGSQEQEKNFSLKLDKIPPSLSARKIPEIFPNAITVKKINDNDVYYLDNFGFIFKTDSNFKGGTKINQIPFPVKQETEYQLDIFDNFLFLKEDKSLYLLEETADSFDKILDNVDNLNISPDKKKLAISANSEIWIFFLKDFLGQPSQKAGDKLFLLRLSQKIRDLFWLNNGYLIFSAEPDIKITEIDNRDKINAVNLAQFPDPEIFWDDSSGKLYVLSQNNLYFTAF